MLVDCFIPQKWAFFSKNTFLPMTSCKSYDFVSNTGQNIEKSSFFGNKTVDQRFGANLKKHVFCKNLLQIYCFFKLFCTKNAENDYFDQRLECTAPKCWSKYTTCFVLKQFLIAIISRIAIKKFSDNIKLHFFAMVIIACWTSCKR